MDQEAYSAGNDFGNNYPKHDHDQKFKLKFGKYHAQSKPFNKDLCIEF